MWHCVADRILQETRWVTTRTAVNSSSGGDDDSGADASVDAGRPHSLTFRRAHSPMSPLTATTHGHCVAPMEATADVSSDEGSTAALLTAVCGHAAILQQAKEYLRKAGNASSAIAAAARGRADALQILVQANQCGCHGKTACKRDAHFCVWLRPMWCTFWQGGRGCGRRRLTDARCGGRDQRPRHGWRLRAAASTCESSRSCRPRPTWTREGQQKTSKHWLTARLSSVALTRCRGSRRQKADVTIGLPGSGWSPLFFAAAKGLFLIDRAPRLVTRENDGRAMCVWGGVPVTAASTPLDVSRQLQRDEVVHVQAVASQDGQSKRPRIQQGGL